MSSTPSLLKSPKALTEAPVLSKGAIPLMVKPFVPFRLERVKVESKPPCFPNTRYALPANSLSLGFPSFAPIMMSSIPSWLISPALLTEKPDLSTPCPLMVKPSLLIRLETLIILEVAEFSELVFRP